MFYFTTFSFPPFCSFVQPTWNFKMAEKEDVDELSIEKDIVVTKYKMAAEMVNGKLQR